MGIYRGPGGSGDATNDASSETRLAVEARDDAIAAKVAAQTAQAAAELAETNAETAQAAAEASAASIDVTNFVEVTDIGSTVQAYDADLTTWAGKTAPSGTVVGTTDTQTLSAKTLEHPIITGTILEDVYTITDGAGFAIDPTNGSIQLITLGASRTPTAANWDAGEAVTLMVNDGTAYTITWTTIGVVWVGGSAPTLATSGYTVIELWKVGSTIYGALVGNVA